MPNRNAFVTVTRGAGRLLLACVLLSLCLRADLVEIVKEPPDRNIFPGGRAVLEVEATAPEPFEYQWFRDGVALPDEQSSTLVIEDAGAEDAGLYTVALSNAYGTTTTRGSRITVSSVVAWGLNSFGQTDVPSGLHDVIGVSTFANHNLALRGDGTVVAGGWNSSGQIEVPPGLAEVVDIAAGEYHSLALRDNGTVVAWGANRFGESDIPHGLSDVVKIRAGRRHSMALKADGSVVVWGDTEYGQLDVPEGLEDVVEIATGAMHSLALKADGTVVAWGSWASTVPDGLTGVVQIAEGDQHSLVLMADGSVGRLPPPGTLGGLGTLEGFTNVVGIASGVFHALGLRNDGTVVTWGVNNHGQADVPEWLESVVAVDGGLAHSLALGGIGFPRVWQQLREWRVLVETGEVFLHGSAVGGLPMSYQWQYEGGDLPGETNRWLHLTGVLMNQAGSYSFKASNAWGEATSPPSELVVMPVAVLQQPEDQVATLGGRAEFSVEVGGHEPFSYQWLFQGMPLPGETNAILVIDDVQLRDGGEYMLEARNALGSTRSRVATLWASNVAAWGYNWYGQTDLSPGVTGVVQVAAGGAHSVALRADGTVLAWGGWNEVGQADVPDGLSDVVAVAAGGYHGLALRADGKVVAWGHLDVGQEVQMPEALGEVVAIAAGGYHDLALRSDGTLVAWGSDSVGQAEIPEGLGPVIAVSAGNLHNLALRADGTVVAWGRNISGQADVPQGLEEVVSIRSGFNHSLALRADGTVVAWGSNEYGESDVPEGLTDVVAIEAGSGHSLALRADGTVVAWGRGDYGQTEVPENAVNVVGISAGSSHNLVILNTGQTLWWELPVPRVTEGAELEFEIPTSRGFYYLLESAEALEDQAWTRVSTFAGDGEARVITEPLPAGGQRFYRGRRMQ
ncbi:MAG: immunoglobulin domain-containing protein [Verrucomicrobiales bacterium]|nr:immunoglobulin domain-containing protein [Verrucomicrobiales bacterium]